MLQDLVAFKNRGAGIWGSGGGVGNEAKVVIDGAVLVGNSVGFFDGGEPSVLRRSLVVGESANQSPVGPDSCTAPDGLSESCKYKAGVIFYDGHAQLEDVSFAGFVPDENAGPISGAISNLDGGNGFDVTVAVNRVRFLDNSRAGFIFNGVRRDHVIPDDGSLTGLGRPGALVSNNPLLTGPGCEPRPDADAMACPDAKYLTVIITGPAVDTFPMRATRQDGATAVIPADVQNMLYSPHNYRSGDEYKFEFGAPVPDGFAFAGFGPAGTSATFLLPYDTAPRTVTLNYGPSRAAASLAEWQAAPQSTYYYDPGTRLLHTQVGAGQRWEISR